jgi:hypothetical protein
MRKLLMILMAAGLALFLAPAAGAQQVGTDPDDYTPPPGPRPCRIVINLGTLFEGDVRTTDASCDWGPGSTVTVTIEGVTFQVTTNAAGLVRVTVTFVSDGVALSRPVLAAAGVELAQSSPVVVRVNANGVVRDVRTQLGSNLVRLTGTTTTGGPGTADIVFNLARRGAIGGGALPRTGAMILRWGIGGGVLLVIGAALVLIDRRRRRPFEA